jgi:hypothetical protein
LLPQFLDDWPWLHFWVPKIVDRFLMGADITESFFGEAQNQARKSEKKTTRD